MPGTGWTRAAGPIPSLALMRRELSCRGRGARGGCLPSILSYFPVTTLPWGRCLGSLSLFAVTRCRGRAGLHSDLLGSRSPSPLQPCTSDDCPTLGPSLMGEVRVTGDPRWLSPR